MEIPLQKLCNNDIHTPLKLECWDYNTNRQHSFIGQLHISVNEMTQLPTKKLTNPEKHNKDQGSIQFSKAELTKKPNFLNYIYGGCQLNFMVAIDFTGSNQNYTQKNSLHNISYGPSQYEQAISAIGSILENYDWDKMFPVWGFGARYSYSAVNHCFTLGQQSEVQGIQGILNTYRQEMPKLEFSGPTLFSQVLKSAAMKAYESDQKNMQGLQSYTILLILTDGQIDDMPNSKECIVDASGLPLSIIIVGIGNANFDKMEELDSDNQILMDCRGRRAQRDIVQFVPFRSYNNNADLLTKAVLAEVPKQLVSYFISRGIQPQVNVPQTVFIQNENQQQNFQEQNNIIQSEIQQQNIVQVELPQQQAYVSQQAYMSQNQQVAQQTYIPQDQYVAQQTYIPQNQYVSQNTQMPQQVYMSQQTYQAPHETIQQEPIAQTYQQNPQ